MPITPDDKKIRAALLARADEVDQHLRAVDRASEQLQRRYVELHAEHDAIQCAVSVLNGHHEDDEQFAFWPDGEVTS